MAEPPPDRALAALSMSERITAWADGLVLLPVELDARRCELLETMVP
jgi:hypothetical protein